jgi:hypothetical protein
VERYLQGEAVKRLRADGVTRFGTADEGRTTQGGGGFDSRRFQAEQPAAFKALPSEKGGGACVLGPKRVFWEQKRTKPEAATA